MRASEVDEHVAERLADFVKALQITLQKETGEQLIIAIFVTHVQPVGVKKQLLQWITNAEPDQFDKMLRDWYEGNGKNVLVVPPLVTRQ